jgi:hypothetical protein
MGFHFSLSAAAMLLARLLVKNQNSISRALGWFWDSL